jgi:hypothetical protein
VSALIEESVRPGGAVHHLPFATVVAEFGLLLRGDARGENRRWGTPSRTLAGMTVSSSLAVDKAGLAELVGTAKGLARLSRR